MATTVFEKQGSSRKTTTHRLGIYPVAMALGVLFAISFTLCVVFDLWFPTLAMSSVWAPLLPGFSPLSWASFLLGLVEAFAYGWFIAIIFVPLFNFFAGQSQTRT